MHVAGLRFLIGVGPALAALRECIGPGEDLAGGLEPVLGEGGLEPADQRPTDAAHHVVPGHLALHPTEPVRRDSRAADEAYLSVDDDQLAMRAVVDAF